jgi:hypothetical protein
MADVQIEAGSLYANTEERIVTGLLLPYGELGNTNLGKFSINSGSVTIPSDPDIVTLNVQHDREEPIGRAVQLNDTPAGIVGTFKIAKTEEGDTVLAEIAAGTRSKLSAEVKNVVIRSRQAVSGVLFGAAVVEQGAFPSAALMAEYAKDTEMETESMADNTLKAEILDIVEDTEGDNIRIEVDTEEQIPEMVLVNTVDPETNEVTQVEFVRQTEEETQEEEEMAQATAPETLQARKAAPAPTNLSSFMADLAVAAKSGSRSLFAEVMKRDDARLVTSLFAALSDVEFDSEASVGINTAQPQWLGELWTGKTYERKYIPLIAQGTMTALTMQAWRWVTKPEVSEWAGNKTDVPSNVPVTESFEVTGQRYAGAHDYAREFRDFGRTDVIESALRGMVESYARITDEATLDALVAGATEVNPDATTALGKLLDGYYAVVDVAQPTFAILSLDLFREIVETEDSSKLAYLNPTIGLDNGSVGGFTLLPSTQLADDTILIGAREAATSFELSGSPIRVEAEAVSVGGFDIGMFGYHAAAVTNADALVKVVAAA